MQTNRCISCEKEIEGYPCPHCGFDAASYQQPGYALPCGHILHGRYLIGKVLGQGGFGITYVGWDLALQYKCAIKEYYPNGQVIRDRSIGTGLRWSEGVQAENLRWTGMESFLKEARKMNKVDHVPQVVRVRDTFVDNETAYIIMDYVEGRTLKDQLEDTGVLSWEEAKKIFLPVISAMVQVHEAGLVHRDLSPDNLMLLPDGSVSILDLGAAKDLTINTGLSSMQVIKGGFSPIEQYSQSGASGPWTDVYAMAATMYYALTGLVPTAAVDRLENDTLRWDLPQLEAIPKSALEAMKMAMEVLARNRTQTMKELLDQLQSRGKKKTAAAKSENLSKTQPIGTAEETKKRGIPLWGWIAGTVGLAAAAAVVIFALSAGAPAPSEPLLQDSHVHDWLPATCEKPKTCASCGATEGTPAEHSWAEATCEKPRTCTVCGTVDGTPSDHQWIAATCREPEHCAFCGESRGTTLAHNWVEANYVSPRRCLSGNEMEGAPLGMPLAAGPIHTIGLKLDGTMNALGNYIYGETYVTHWSKITSADAGDKFSIALRKDGKVMFAGDDEGGTLKVAGWTDIIAIAAGTRHAVGLRADGTVVATGNNDYGQCDVGQWTDIVSVSAGGNHTVGLKSDGTLVAAGLNSGGQCDVGEFKDIISISCGDWNTLALRADGTIASAGIDGYTPRKYNEWTDIVAISAGPNHTVGLKADGTVVAEGGNEFGQCNVEGWKNVVAIEAAQYYTVALKSDGYVVCVGEQDHNQYRVEGWNLLMPW